MRLLLWALWRRCSHAWDFDRSSPPSCILCGKTAKVVVLRNTAD